MKVQETANCIIGKDYPFPMLDEHAEKDRCIAKIKNAFALGLHGADPEVLSGEASRLLREKHEDTGAEVVKTEKEKKEEKGRAKRERNGDQSLDAFVKRKKE